MFFVYPEADYLMLSAYIPYPDFEVRELSEKQKMETFIESNHILMAGRKTATFVGIGKVTNVGHETKEEIVWTYVDIKIDFLDKDKLSFNEILTVKNLP